MTRHGRHIKPDWTLAEYHAHVADAVRAFLTSDETVLDEVRQERARQDAKWGEQNHPDGTGEEYAYHRDVAQLQCDERFASGEGSYADILAEEFYEALAESDPARPRDELIQVAAVAVAWVEAIDRRAALAAATETRP